MRVRRIPLTHLVGRRSEQAGAVEDVGILREKAEDQPRHKMVHIRSALGGRPFGIVLQQLDIELVEPPRRSNVERAFSDLPDGGDARQRQEETEVIGKLCILAGDGRIVAGDVLGLERLTVGGEDELGFGRCCFRAVAQRLQGSVNLACRACRQVNVAALENAACNIRSIKPTRSAKALYGGVLVPEGCLKLISEIGPIKG